MTDKALFDAFVFFCLVDNPQANPYFSEIINEERVVRRSANNTQDKNNKMFISFRTWNITNEKTYKLGSV